MIRRMDAPPKRVNPSGWISEGITTPLKRLSSKIGSSGGQEPKGQLAEQLPPPVRMESPIDLTSSPIPVPEKVAHPQAEDTQIPLSVYVIFDIVWYYALISHGFLTEQLLREAISQPLVSLLNHV